MEQQKKYNLKCRTCKKKTPHSIYHVSRRRGAKLHCLNCRTKTLNYHNLQRLKEYVPTIKLAKAGGYKNGK